MKPVRVFEEAKRDLDEALAFYESRREGLGLEFFAEYQATLARVIEGPLPGTLITGSRSKYRLYRVFFHRFPYKFVVADFPAEYGSVAIARDGRRPGYWESRLAKVRR